MSKPILDGKKHISEKPKTEKVTAAFKPRNLLDIPNDIAQDIENKGMEYRWVDAKQMAEAGNMHRNYWEIYKRPTDTVSQGAQVFGLPADGTVRRGTLILAVRPKELGDGHRAQLRERARLQRASVKKQGDELRRMARSAGVRDAIDDSTEIE